MSLDKQILFTPIRLKNITLPNRFVRSATYEGMADDAGRPDMRLADLYCELAGNNVGTIITGFCFISQQGRAMHPAQAGISYDELIEPWRRIVQRVKETCPGTKLIMQLAHTGRQTLSKVTGQKAVGPATKKCSYFKESVKPLSESQIEAIVEEFAYAAERAQKAGFDGVQIHAAHGYLIHQFLSPDTNIRNDKWTDRNLFLYEILKSVRQKCGENYPIMLKLSHSDDKTLTVNHTIETIRTIEEYIDAVEISYGTMELALNIFRGGCPVDLILRINPLFNNIPIIFRKMWKYIFLNRYLKKFKPFTENYNLSAAIEISRKVNVPVFPVGGIRTLQSMVDIIRADHLPAVSMCRPFISEPNLVQKILEGSWHKSDCTHCNKCAIYCDADQCLQCYSNK